MSGSPAEFISDWLDRFNSPLFLPFDTQVFEGVPPPYDTHKRMVVPAALRVSHLKPGRDFAHLGKLASEVGWKHFDLIKRLEAARKVQSGAFYAKKKEGLRRLAVAKAAVTA